MNKPVLNHVAISMPAAVLDDRGRADLFGQFVYLLPSETPLTAPALDHFGLQVETLPEVHAIVDAAKRYAERDDRVEIIDVHARTTHGPANDYVLTSAYIGFVLPLMIELQHLERIER
jgi:hypothetical protein